MELNQFERADSLFHRALSQPANDRDAFIESESQGDAALAQRVRRLIRFAEADAPTLNLLVDTPHTNVDDGIDMLVGVTIDRYQIGRRIGEGGFGVVYEAEQRQPMQRRVAVKILRSGMDSERVISRFSAERQALAMMDHPNIARIFDAGQTEPALGSRPYFVMEFVDGVPLTDYCNEHELDCGERLELFITICQAVQHAHQKGTIHRDIKPSNILVTNVDGIATPKVIDFGIAKAILRDGAPTHTQMTEAQQLLGTPQYMSPEQADFDAHDLDTRADIYSLGVVLYELLTDSTPLQGGDLQRESHAMMRQRIRTQKLERPSVRVSRTASASSPTASRRRTDARSLRTKLKGDLDWIVLKALEPERDRRYSSAAAFADDIRKHLDHEPVSAGAPGALHRMGKFVRRHRIVTAASVLIALALVGGLVSIAMGIVRMHDAAEQTTAINEFMRDVLTSAAPDKLGADVRLVDVLRNGSESASRRFAGHQETEAQVRALLGQVYLALDFEAESTNEFAKSAALWTDVFGPDDRRTIAASVLELQSLVNQAKGRDAERLLADLLPRMKRTMPEDDPMLLLPVHNPLRNWPRQRARGDRA